MKAIHALLAVLALPLLFLTSAGAEDEKKPSLDYYYFDG